MGILSFLSGWQGYVIGGAMIALVAGFGGEWTRGKIDAANYEKLELSIAAANQRALTQAISTQKSLDAASAAADEAAIKKQQVIVTQTKTVIEKVPYYVSAETDATFPLPCGFIRLHDAAASGADPATVAIPAGLTDASACPVKASDAAVIIAENYGNYRAIAAELTGLQDCVKQENQALQNSATGIVQ